MRAAYEKTNNFPPKEKQCTYFVPKLKFTDRTGQYCSPHLNFFQFRGMPGVKQVHPS